MQMQFRETFRTSPCCSPATLAELMRDPMTEALMTADRVDRRALESLIAEARQNIRTASFG